MLNKIREKIRGWLLFPCVIWKFASGDFFPIIRYLATVKNHVCEWVCEFV